MAANTWIYEKERENNPELEAVQKQAFLDFCLYGFVTEETKEKFTKIVSNDRSEQTR